MCAIISQILNFASSRTPFCDSQKGSTSACRGLQKSERAKDLRMCMLRICYAATIAKSARRVHFRGAMGLRQLAQRAPCEGVERIIRASVTVATGCFCGPIVNIQSRSCQFHDSQGLIQITAGAVHCSFARLPFGCRCYWRQQPLRGMQARTLLGRMAVHDADLQDQALSVEAAHHNRHARVRAPHFVASQCSSVVHLSSVSQFESGGGRREQSVDQL